MEVEKIKKNKLSALLANLAILLSLESYQPEALEEGIIIKEEIKSELDGLKIDAPEESGPINNLPWAQDPDFLKAQERNDTDVLMAAYCTVFQSSLPGESYNVELTANALSGIVLEPGEVFSQNQKLGPYTEDKGYKEGLSYIGSNLVPTIGGGVCKIATTLYNTAILSNLEILARANHSMPVAYVPYGQDATVAYGVKDFKFRNDKDFPILIWAKSVDNRLYIAFYGQEKPSAIEWGHKITNRVEAPTIYKENPQLAQGEENILVQGMDGATVESWINIENEDGDVETRQLGTSYYRPMPRIIEINSQEINSQDP